MTAQAAKEIIAEINSHMSRSGHRNHEWYVGIASDVQQRLFEDHRVPRKDHWFIYRRTRSLQEARTIEAEYHKAGCYGGPDGGDHGTSYVYAYVKTPQTVQ